MRGVFIAWEAVGFAYWREVSSFDNFPSAALVKVASKLKMRALQSLGNFTDVALN